MDKKIPTISGQFKKFQEIMKLNINKTLIKLKNESIDKEYDISQSNSPRRKAIFDFLGLKN